MKTIAVEQLKQQKRDLTSRNLDKLKIALHCVNTDGYINAQPQPQMTFEMDTQRLMQA